MQKSACLFVFLFSAIFVTACSSAYYGTMEKLGVHKRDIMVDRVTEAKETQEEAKEQFQSAYEKFVAVVDVDASDLQKEYNILNEEYVKSKEKADEVHERIQGVESVSEALFKEWKSELKQYSSDSLRRDSEKKLEQTREQYEQLIAAMKKAEEKIQPVLVVFHDQVLYLKHNLNAQAISSLRGELVSLEKDVNRLLQEMEASIQETDEFITHLQNG